MAKHKIHKKRGTRSCGYGRKKRHRGAGSRGGRGMAGSGKRAHHKKQMILKRYGKEYFGKKGFKCPTSKEIKFINIDEIIRNLESFSKKEDDFYVINLNEFGIDKLLGRGNVNVRLKVVCKACSESARKKIEAAGGVVNVG